MSPRLQRFQVFRDLPRACWVLSLGTLINRIGTMAYPFLMLYLTNHRQVSLAFASQMVGLFGLTSIFVSPIAGWMSDRWGSQKLLLFSLYSSGLFLCLYPFAYSKFSIGLLTVLWASTTQLFRPAAHSAIASVVAPEQRRLAYSLQRFCINLGMSIGPAAGGILAHYSFPLLFVIDGISTLLAAIWFTYTLHIPKEPSAERHGFVDSLKGPLRDSKFMLFLLALIPVNIAFCQTDSILPMFVVEELKLTTAFYGMVFTINTVMIVFLEIYLNLKTSHWSFFYPILLAMLFVAAGDGILIWATSGNWVIATVIVWTFGEMFLFPSTNQYVMDLAPAALRGAYSAMYVLSYSVSQWLSPIIGTFLVTHYSYQANWTACAGLSLVSLVGMAMISRKNRPQLLVTA